MNFRTLTIAGLCLASTGMMGAESQQIDLAKGVSGMWKLIDFPAAGTGKVLAGDNESALIPFKISEPGKYKIWVKFHTEKDKSANLLLLVRSKEGEAIRCEKIDYPFHALNKAKPYIPNTIERAEGARWHNFELPFEYAGDYTINFGKLPSKGAASKKQVESVFISNDPAFNPEKDSKISSTQGEVKAVSPEGFMPATPYSVSSSVFCGIKDTNKQYKAGIIQNGSIYEDPAAMVLMGINRDHGNPSDAKYGILTMRGAVIINKNSPEFKKNNPAPKGHFVNAAGTVGSNYSIAYDESRKDYYEYGKVRMKGQFDNETIETWCIAGEAGGWMDYSPEAVTAFRAWLSQKYSNIEGLNKAWRSQFKSFDEISPAKSADENKTNWLEFREFCGTMFARAIAEAVDFVNEMDPQKRQATAQFSNADFLAVGLSSFRPVDFEELILTGLKNTDNVAWDSYCVDDYMGAEVDLIDSLGNGKKMVQREFNTHTPDPVLAARTYWTMVGKGIKGVSLCQFQEGGFHDGYPKWGLTNTDMSPRIKLAAYSDAIQEVHRIENILMDAKKIYPVKPVAIYFSKIDNSLQKHPLSSEWGEGIDSPYHVYEMLRGRGYPVTWITPRQIEAGKLKDMAAVVFVDAQHISAKASDMIVEWVKGGGAVIGDTWPGAYDSLGHRQDTLLKLFGISPAERARVDKIKLEESAQGYGEVTIAAINPDKLYQTVMETWQQWDSTHPVAKAMGNYMFSGHGAERIKCDAGEVVGMVFDGYPGVVINQTGKGQSMYVSTMLGSIFGGSATRYEWDLAHSEMSPIRLLDAFLNFAGVKKLSEVELPERVAFKVRVEAPLVDSDGNAIITLASYNDDVLRPFALKLAWPANVKVPKKIFAAVGGKRTLEEIPFKLNDGKIELKMPSFNSHASLIAVSKSTPLLALDFGAAPRGDAGLVSVNPGQVEKAKITIYNVTGEKLEGGKLKLRLPQGWFCDKEIIDVPAIAPWESANAEFSIKSPAFCAAKRVRPISVLFEAKNTSSMPCTEMVWWQDK